MLNYKLYSIIQIPVINWILTDPISSNFLGGWRWFSSNGKGIFSEISVTNVTSISTSYSLQSFRVSPNNINSISYLRANKSSKTCFNCLMLHTSLVKLVKILNASFGISSNINGMSNLSSSAVQTVSSVSATIPIVSSIVSVAPSTTQILSKTVTSVLIVPTSLTIEKGTQCETYHQNYQGQYFSSILANWVLQ